MKTITDAVASKVLNDRLRPRLQSTPGGEPEYNWKPFLRVAEDNAAHLVFSPDSDSVRIAITKVESKTIYDIQLNQTHLKVTRGHRYIISFIGRADSPRSLCFGFARGHAPWTNLGYYNQVELTSEWQHFEGHFVAEENEANGRIHFDVGGSDVSVELSLVTLRSLSEDRFVKPEFVSDASSQPVRDTSMKEPPVEFGKVDFGSLRRVIPISQEFGWDRGCPIDRYYIENFLAHHAEDVRGRVLEIGENTYTRKYGGARVLQSDILHVIEAETQATIIADLTKADHIPTDTFDCIILTQTLQLIYDVRAALNTIYRILKPSGVLLSTFPGISQTYDHKWADTWYWHFTKMSARRVFEEVFSPVNVKIETFGNVLSAISFLHGLAVEELTREELDYCDIGYDVTITVRAVKPSSRENTERT